MPDLPSRAGDGPVIIARDEQTYDTAAGVEQDYGAAVGGAIDAKPRVQVSVDVDRWAALASGVLLAEGVTRGEMGLLFVDPQRIAALNEAHMGETGPTDVLAFPIDGTALAADGEPGEVLIGDVVVCPQRAAAQAPEHTSAHHNGTLDDELALLVVHGVLHLQGYDHHGEAETQIMRARERELLAALHRQDRGGAANHQRNAQAEVDEPPRDDCVLAEFKTAADDGLAQRQAHRAQAT